MDSMNFADLVTKKAISLRCKHLRDDDLDGLEEALRKSKVLEEIDLYDNHLTLADGKFTDALAHNRTLKYLFLACNKIGDEGAKRLADALKANNTLKKLSLHCNQIGDEGAKHIAAALMENETLEAIGFAWNKIGDDGAKSLANCFMVNESIRKVNLWDNNISDDGAKKLIEALKWNYGIRILYMEGNPISRRVEAEINDLLNDPKRKVPHAQMKNVHEEIERKDEAMKHVREEVSTLETSLATKDQQLASLAADKTAAGEEVATLKTALATKDQQLASIKAEKNAAGEEVATLKTALATNDQLPASIKAEKDAAGEEVATLKTALATKDQQLIASIKAEKNAAEAKLQSIKDKKETMKTGINDTRNVKVKQEAGDTTNIYNAETDDDERASPLGSNDTRNVKVKQEAGDTTNIYNAETDDDERGSPKKKKQKTEKAQGGATDAAESIDIYTLPKKTCKKLTGVDATIEIRDRAKTRNEMASELTPGTWVIFKSENDPVQKFWLGKTISKSEWGNECIWLNNTRGSKDVEGAQIAAGTYAINVQWYTLKDESVPLLEYIVEGGDNAQPFVCSDNSLLCAGFDKTINQVSGSRVRVPRQRTIQSNRMNDFDYTDSTRQSLQTSEGEFGNMCRMDKSVRDFAMERLGQWHNSS